MLKTLRVAVMMGVVAGGCGSASHDAPASAVEACMQLQQATARHTARCNGGSVADWKAYEESWQPCAEYAQHVADGTVRYRRDRFAACLAAYDKACDDTGISCFFEVLEGVVPDGAPCQSPEVCGAESTCLALPGGATCGEVCARAPRENETCGFYCDGGPTPCWPLPICFFDLACVNDVCVKARTAGQPCGASDPVPCLPSLRCTADPADPQSTGTCVARGTGACRADLDCAATDFCLQGACAARRAVGQPCSDARTACVPFAVCDAVSGSCVAAGRPGLPCTLYPGDPEVGYCWIGACTAEGICLGSTGPGESCAQATCASGSSCDSTSLTCVACPSR